MVKKFNKIAQFRESHIISTIHESQESYTDSIKREEKEE
jgi:hypothetical protein